MPPRNRSLIVAPAGSRGVMMQLTLHLDDAHRQQRATPSEQQPAGHPIETKANIPQQARASA
jgi:hypothetical protein